ncbi:response regulator [Yinghuangia seranimata]|uniref:response regulator n=1 Tax=Yinghuangia seranimata TaxID=408067 RepID=UPI00248AE8F1|nr:response regulator transcription factor [Yinghuangia seranimata]MDI2125242.1 response regulator transcription factor [Yinghuangia seranimata]
MAPIRVLFADDHPVFLSGLRLLAETSGDLTAVGFAHSGGEAVELALELRPDVVVLDVNMPGTTGIAAARRLAVQAPDIAVLMLTMFDDDETVFAALRGGARGYVLKGAGPDELLSAIRAVAHGEAVFGSTLATRMLGHFRELGALRPFPELTDREHDVLELVAQGLPNAAIARRLALSEKTVRNHVSNILTKLQVDRPQAIVRAREAGLGTGPGDAVNGSAADGPSAG